MYFRKRLWCRPVTFMFLTLGVFIWASYSNGNILHATASIPDTSLKTDSSIFDVTGCGRPVKLDCELSRLYQAGGKITLTRGSSNQIIANRSITRSTNRVEEMENRIENWRIFKKLNIAKDYSPKANGFEITIDQVTLLELFALTDYGAVFIREVVTDMLAYFNKGYFEMFSKIDLDTIDIKTTKLSDLLTGNLTEDGEFDIVSLFNVNSCPGFGAKAQPGFITLGHKGFRKNFPLSQEEVEPLAIIAHEFGHTKYGDPTSGGHLAGEAATVINYENPVRIFNRFPPRKEYCFRNKNECYNVVSLTSRIVL